MSILNSLSTRWLFCAVVLRLCDQRTGSHSGTRIHVRHCFGEGKTRYSCELHVEDNWRKILIRSSLSLLQLFTTVLYRL